MNRISSIDISKINLILEEKLTSFSFFKHIITNAYVPIQTRTHTRKFFLPTFKNNEYFLKAQFFFMKQVKLGKMPTHAIADPYLE